MNIYSIQISKFICMHIGWNRICIIYKVETMGKYMWTLPYADTLHMHLMIK